MAVIHLNRIRKLETAAGALAENYFCATQEEADALVDEARLEGREPPGYLVLGEDLSALIDRPIRVTLGPDDDVFFYHDPELARDVTDEQVRELQVRALWAGDVAHSLMRMFQEQGRLPQIWADVLFRDHDSLKAF